MRSSDTANNPSYVPSFKYPILVGVFEFGAPQPVVEESIKLLNAAKTRIRFTRLDTMATYPHKSAYGITFSDGDTLLPFCEYRLEENPNCQLIIGVYPFRILEGLCEPKTIPQADLDVDYFSLPNSSLTCSVISLKDLDVYALRAGRPLKIALGGLMLSEVTCLLYHYDSQTEHLDSEGCLLDYCDTKEEIVPSLVGMNFCQKREERVTSGELGKDLFKLAHMLRSPPWYRDQPTILWASIPLLGLGILFLILGSLLPGNPLSGSFVLLSSILIPIGGVFFGLWLTPLAKKG